MQSKVIPLDVIKHILELNHDLSTMREYNIPLSQISTYLRTKEREIKDKYQLDDMDLVLIRFNIFRNFTLDSMLILGRGNPHTIFYVFQSRKLFIKPLKNN